MSNVKFWQGNKACAYAAIHAGCTFFAGYPITPASEIAEHLSKLLPKVDGNFIQMEDEIGAISAIIGSAWGGARAMTATSGPGFSLMQEGISYAIMTETPIVIIDVQRTGPSTGQATKTAQGDLLQARWGNHGDHSIIVLSPNSVQEFYDLTIRAFDLAEKYRTPVIILSDETVSHSREKVILKNPENINIKRILPSNHPAPPFENMWKEGRRVFPNFGNGDNLLVTGSTHDEWGRRKTSDPLTHRKLMKRIMSKIYDNIADIFDYEISGDKNANIGFVSFGSTSRSVYESVNNLREKGFKILHLRLKTVWPIDEKTIRNILMNLEYIFVPELNLGQLKYDIERLAPKHAKIIPINKIGGGELITPEEIISNALKILS